MEDVSFPNVPVGSRPLTPSLYSVPPRASLPPIKQTMCMRVQHSASLCITSYECVEQTISRVLTSLQLSVLRHIESDVSSSQQLAALSHLGVLLARPLGEAPLLRHHDLLAAGELHLGTTQSLDGDLLLVILGTDGNQRLANAHASDQTVGLTEGVTHTGLQTIGTGAGKHLVDTSDVVRMSTHTHVEGILASVLHQVLVGSNTGGFESLRGQLGIKASLGKRTCSRSSESMWQTKG